MPTLIIDGNELTVEPGTTIIQATQRLGIEIPHYCYHPGLSLAGSCRMCMVEVEKAPKLSISCYTEVAEGMVVRTDTERVKQARQAILEFLLINHPLDCPVCDQAGECWLQIYYMEHGLYNSRFLEDKVKKHKAMPIGPHVMLDSERCILCSRCVRFCNEISKSNELGIFQRGDHSELLLAPGKSLDNPYAGNVVDICPVGALTDRDFRFKCRVWYLDRVDTICPGCSNGCNIQLHVNRRRPHHGGGKQVMRVKPRYNGEVNQWWICDAGRYGYHAIEDDRRLLHPLVLDMGEQRLTTWSQALEQVAATLRGLIAKEGPDSVAVLVSPQLTNEELYLLRRLFCQELGVSAIDYRLPVVESGVSDEFLIKADKNPNSRGAELIGLVPRQGAMDITTVLQAAAAGRVKALYVAGQDLVAALGEEAVLPALSSLSLLVYQGSHCNRVSSRAHVVFPASTYAEQEGSFTNHAGRVQLIHPAIEPLGESLPGWEILVRLSHYLGIDFSYTSAAAIFSDLAKTMPAFYGLSYKVIGSGGKLVSAGEPSGAGG